MVLSVNKVRIWQQKRLPIKSVSGLIVSYIIQYDIVTLLLFLYASKRNIVKFELDPKSPPALTATQRERLAALAVQPDSEIDYSDIPKQATAVKWSRPGALVSAQNEQHSG